MKNLCDNTEKIRKLLTWNSPNEYYYIQLYTRKKDGTSTLSNKHAERVLSSFTVRSLEEYDDKIKFVKQICDATQCRAGIHLNKLNEKTFALTMLERATKCVLADSYKKMHAATESIRSNPKSSKYRSFIIDVDGTKNLEILATIDGYLRTVRPYNDNLNKIVEVLDTYTGYHLVCSPFNIADFLDKTQLIRSTVSMSGNLTALYYPKID